MSAKFTNLIFLPADQQAENYENPPPQLPNQKNLHSHIHTLGASSVTPSSADTWVLQSREDCTPEDIFGPKPHLMEELGLMVNEPKDASFRMCTAVRDLELEVGLQIFCLRCRSKVPLTEAMAAIDAAMADNDMQHSICPQQGTISSLKGLN